MFNINFIRLINWLFPGQLLLPKIKAYVNSCISPIIQVYNDFYQRRLDNIYKLTHNGQVCYLKASLNDRFDKNLRRITIKDGNRYNRVYLYTTAEHKPKYLGTIHLYTNKDYADTGVDFIVKVPLALENSINNFEIISLINFYKLASKRYSIVYE